MNESTMRYWKEISAQLNLPSESFVRAYRFGDTPDELAALVAKGIKTTTSNALTLFEASGKALPKVGDYNIILNKDFEPVCLIRIERVEIKLYDEIDEAFAIAEGDGSYETWDAIHVRYFTEQLSKLNVPFSRKIPLLCQTFKLIHIK